MKRFILLATLAATTSLAGAADVGVSISVAEPGFYGRIDIGDFPPPQLVYPKPVLIRPAPRTAAPVQPIYLHVPPGHARKWRKHCHRYHACGQPVYFVQERWYNDVYVPHHSERQGPRGEGRGRGPDEHRGPGDHGHDRGHGKGH